MVSNHGQSCLEVEKACNEIKTIYKIPSEKAKFRRHGESGE
jgi:hypothetical protein